MDISSLTNISSDYITQTYNQSKAASAQEENSDSFGAVFDTAVKMLNETNDYQNDAEAAEVRFVCLVKQRILMNWQRYRKKQILLWIIRLQSVIRC